MTKSRVTLADILAANAQFGPLDLDLVRKAMDADTLADINKLDAVVRQLGIGERFKDPAEEIEKLQDRYSAACLMRDALKTENEMLREKLADVHRLMCEASAMLAGLTAGDVCDVDGAFSNIQLALRRSA